MKNATENLNPCKGPFKYYVSKIVGGWVRSNAYVCLHGGWVGLAKCLRNQKNHWKMDFLKIPIDKGQNISKVIFLANHSCKKRRKKMPNSEIWDCHCWKKIFWGWVGFQKSYVIFRVGHGKYLRLLTRVGFIYTFSSSLSCSSSLSE